MTTKTKTTNATNTRSKLETLLTALLAGMQNDLPSTIKSITLDGQAYTPAQLDTQFQDGLDAFANARAAKAAYASAVASAKATEQQVRALSTALVAWLKQQFGATNAEMLGDFGVTPKAPKKTSMASKVVGAAKRASTVKAKQAAAQQAADANATAVVVGANGVQLAAPAVPAASAPSSAGTVAAK